MSFSYCQFAATDPLHGAYHDSEYGFPISDESLLFERLILEINQAGLSWTTILKKKDGFRDAYDGFSVDTVAAYGEEDFARLMQDARVIRNRLKINAAIENARVIQELRQTHGSFLAWLDHHHPLPKEQWVKVFKKTFRFTGGEIVNEFLMSIGYLPGAHEESCPVFARISKMNPAWQRPRPARESASDPMGSEAPSNN